MIVIGNEILRSRTSSRSDIVVMFSNECKKGQCSPIDIIFQHAYPVHHIETSILLSNKQDIQNKQYQGINTE